jgi:hypothetical protein
MKIQSQKITDLSFDPRNARKHPEANMTALVSSLKQFGQRKPIVITAAGKVVAGNGTLEAARRLGWSEIETVEIPADWDEAKITAFAIADNRTSELAEWDTGILLEQLSDLVDFDFSAFGFDDYIPEEIRVNDVSLESRGSGNPIIHYDIIFEDETQQAIWFQFMRNLNQEFPNEDTFAAKLVAHIERNNRENL